MLIQQTKKILCMVISSIVTYYITFSYISADKKLLLYDIESITKEFAEDTDLLSRLALDINYKMSKNEVEKLLISKYKNVFFKNDDESDNIILGNMVLVFEKKYLIEIKSLNQDILKSYIQK